MNKKKQYSKNINIIGNKYCRLTVLQKIKKNVNKYHYKCICECNKIVYVYKYALENGLTKSCGCRKRKSSGEALKNRVIAYYKYNAKRKGLEFSLSNSDCENLFNGNCYYCNVKPCNIISGHRLIGVFIYNGIDRMDNSKGYIIKNCVSCCKFCNNIKLSMNKEEFLLWISNIYNNYIKKGKKKWILPR